MKKDEHRDSPAFDEAEELLERTRIFLARCVEDPDEAFETEDPDDLRHRLYALTHAPEAATPEAATTKLTADQLQATEDKETPVKKKDKDPPLERRRSA